MSRSQRTSPVYGERVGDALKFAADAFAFRVRKGSGVPYLTHLLQVMVTVGEWGGDEDQMVAAVLHDYLEDIDGSSADELEARFGPTVRDYVLRLSDTTTRPKPAWRGRKERYIEALRQEPHALKLISAADKLHNATSIVRDHATLGDEVFDRFTASMDETLWYYREVVAALADGFDHPLVDELREVVARMHALVGRPYP